ncbi:hypothetical protein ABG067_004159 [Albugo candida]|uniref:Uncharacterized protein n=1 Tax=Albugo candida TaxID=65357 RepID=A0A024GHY3_9STRA|nr:unnamed protein product [Albugo candida]|eukprot:CCI45923.1 unnamed protein product [Albugo candida]
MSTRRGDNKRKGPKHQNKVAFRHNPKSKKTEKILSTPILGLCPRCHDQIVWRKKYRKYKPLTQPSSCCFCHQRNVLAAYHQACDSCATARQICAKCCQKQEDPPETSEHIQETNASQLEPELDDEMIIER